MTTSVRSFRIVGHGATRVSGGPVLCACGWVPELPATIANRKAAYAVHLAQARLQPIACRDCSVVHPRSEMSVSTPGICKPCRTQRTIRWASANPHRWNEQRRASHLKKKYGLTVAGYEALLAAQGGVCAICERTPLDPRGFSPHVDHDHATGKVRGILCGRCNRGIGQFQDDPHLLELAAQYLRSRA